MTDRLLGISAIAGVWIIRSRGKQEARRAIVDLLVDQKRDAELTRAKQKIRELHDHNENNLARFLQQTESDEYKAILLALNTHEFIASGIRTRALDEDIYKRLRYSTVMKDWEAFNGFVSDFRRLKGKATLFQDLEWLYLRWRKSPLKADM